MYQLLQRLPQSHIGAPRGHRRNLHGDEFPDVFGMHLRHSPGHTRAPIMPDDCRLLFSKMTDQPQHIVHQQIYLVIFDARGLVAQVVPAHVRRNDRVAFAERHQLMSPRIPELRKTVQQDDEPLAAATLGVMQAHAADLRVAVPNGRIKIYQSFCHIKEVMGDK